MIKSILVPTDFSDCAGEALKTACHIARRVNAEIILLHVLADSKSSSSIGERGQWNGADPSSGEIPFMMKLMKDVKRKMSKLILSSKFKSVHITDVIETGEVSEKIKSASEKYKAQLIVMGMHGARRLSDIFMGSTSSRVIRNAEIPILSIKDGALKKIENIVFATDFSEETNLVFPFIKSLAEMFGAKVHLLKILIDSDMSGINRAKHEGIQFDHENKVNYPVQIIHHVRSKEEGIRRFADMVHADLLALGTHGRHGLDRFFKGSLAEDMVNHASLPVLTINFHRKLVEQQIHLNDEAARIMKKNTKKNISYSSHIPIV